MNTNLINARPDAATSERARETKVTDRATVASACHSTANHAARQVEKLLLPGAENAIPSVELAKLTGVSSVRALQLLIAQERADGALILSNSTGYFLPDAAPEKSAQELQSFIHTLNARALSTLKVLRTAKRALRYSQLEQVEIGGSSN